MTRFDLLIIGSGHGGAQAAIALRQGGFAGTLAIVTADPDPPYERPPLSKDYLLGRKGFDRILIRPERFWAERDIVLLPGRRIVALDPAARIVRTEAGEEIGYGALIWAAGGAARRLDCDGAGLEGVHILRSRADADRLLAELPDVRRAVVIGGGYIGLEAAAALTALGKQVTIVEALDRLLPRVAGAALSDFLEAEHRARSVEIRLGATVAGLDGDRGRLTGIRLAGGETIEAEIAIVGIGIAPEIGPLLDAGADGGDGVGVDAKCRTSLPDVFAIGDCARHANVFAGGDEVRLESVQNAVDQANVAARTILGQDVAYDAMPWFWSNQYDLRLQTVGLSRGHDSTVLRGDPAQRSFALIYLKQGKVIALDCVNDVRDYVQGRALILAGAVLAPERLADTGIPLKAMV